MKKVLLIFGGNSSENLVSCKSAKSIIENIDASLFSIASVYINLDNKWYLFNEDINRIITPDWIKEELEVTNIIEFIKQFDVVFPITHGTNGEDGKLQGMLELFNIPFVGCKTLSSALGMDKGFAKIIYDEIDIPQVPYITINYKKFNYFDILRKLKFPLIVKPANGGSSIGINTADNIIQLKKAIDKASVYDKRIVIEEFVTARELECSVFEDKKVNVSSVGEIILNTKFYDYNAKYVNYTQTRIPADIPSKVSKKIKKIAKKAFLALDCTGFARVDFLYDEKNDQIYLNEINTLPGFTDISMFPKLLIHDGIKYKDIITLLINDAIL